jgi:hypothetical protein
MRRAVFGLILLAACTTVAAQQPPPPGLPSARLQHAFPPGAKAGPPPKVVRFGIVITRDHEVTVVGNDLDDPEQLWFSHPGIKGEYIEPPEPPSDPKKKDAPPKKKQKGNPSANGPHKFKVTVAADVPPGTYDLRVVGKYGVSNPRAFVVGNGEEANEKEPNNDVPEAQRIAIGTTVSGVFTNPTDVDYTLFAGKKGQRVLVSCVSSAIDGRATPLVEVFDSAGRKLAANRNYRDSDALADLVLPADGEYYVRLSQFAYQGGGADHFYRMTISTGPWIDSVFPPVVEPGKPAQVTLYGRNLPNGQPAGFMVDGAPLEKLAVTISPPADKAAATKLAVRGRIEPVTALQDGFEYTFKGPNGVSNAVPIYFAREKLVVKKNAGGSTAATAEPIPAPCEVVGFLGRRGDSDWYSFNAKKGEQFVVEVSAEKIGTQADFFFSVRDGKDSKKDFSGEQDDDNDTLHPLGFYTKSTDPPAYKFTAPEDGKYLVVVGCREADVAFGPRSAYKLRVSPAKPDFRVIAMPYSRHYQTGATVWQGGTQAFDMFVQRIDGYTGSVAVTVEGLPAGVTAKPLTIGPGAKYGTLVLTAKADAAPAVDPFTVKATGTDAAGKKLTRDVRPATVTWGINTQQQPVPVLSRLDQSFVLAVRAEKTLYTLVAEVAKATTKIGGKDEKLAAPIVVKQGEKFSVPLKVNWVSADKQPVQVTAEPIGQSPQASPVTVQIPTQPTKDKPEGVANFDVKTSAPPGTYTLVLKGVAQVPFVKDPMSKQKGPNVPAEEFSEPIVVNVIPSSVAKLSVTNLPNNTLKLGAKGELTVKVERQHNFTGEFKVKLTLPKGVERVTVADATIPAGKDEAKLVVEADDDAKPGAVTDATITVTAKYDGKHPITHETKVTFTLAK